MVRFAVSDRATQVDESFCRILSTVCIFAFFDRTKPGIGPGDDLCGG